MNTIEIYFPYDIEFNEIKPIILQPNFLSETNKLKKSNPLILSENPPDCVLKKMKENHECPNFTPCEGHSDIESFCTNNSFNETLKTGKTFYGHVYVFRDVTTTNKGFVKTSSETVFDIGGCWNGMNIADISSGNTNRTIILDEAISLIFLYSYSYYHLMFDLLPALILLRPLLIQNPDIPILIRTDVNLELVKTLAGMSKLRLKFVHVAFKTMVKVKRLYVVASAACKTYPPKLIRGLHQHIFSNMKRLLSLQPPELRPQILLGQRKSTRRLENFEELEEIVSQKYPHRIFKFDYDKTDLSIVASLFGKTDIFISPHGAGFSNMLFMKNNSILIEVIPDKYKENCFALIAEILGFQRYQIMGKGGWKTPIVLEDSQFKTLVKTVNMAVDNFNNYFL